MTEQVAFTEMRETASFLRELRGATATEREVFVSLQQELRRIARAKMRHERLDHTLQATALINEAFIKIHKTTLPHDFWEDPSKALRLIAHAMEQILNDYADAYNARKRGGGQLTRVPLDERQAREFALDGEADLLVDPQLFIAPHQSEEILAVRESLAKLRKISPRQAQVLMLQYYCGLTQEEVAASLNLSVETIKVETRKAKTFLKALLQEYSGEHGE